MQRISSYFTSTAPMLLLLLLLPVPGPLPSSQPTPDDQEKTSALECCWYRLDIRTCHKTQFILMFCCCCHYLCFHCRCSSSSFQKHPETRSNPNRTAVPLSLFHQPPYLSVLLNAQQRKMHDHSFCCCCCTAATAFSCLSSLPRPHTAWRPSFTSRQRMHVQPIRSH